MTIRRLTAGVVAASAALALAAPACAQASSDQTATGTMTLFLPIILQKASDLSFGTVTRPTSGSGTVSVNATTAAVSATGGITTINNGPGASASRAVFNVSGEGGMTFTVAVPETFNMTQAGADPLTVTLTSTMAAGQLSGTYGTSGAASFGVGGSVQLSSTTTTGAYSGTFTVTVAYN